MPRDQIWAATRRSGRVASRIRVEPRGGQLYLRHLQADLGDGRVHRTRHSACDGGGRSQRVCARVRDRRRPLHCPTIGCARPHGVAPRTCRGIGRRQYPLRGRYRRSWDLLGRGGDASSLQMGTAEATTDDAPPSFDADFQRTATQGADVEPSRDGWTRACTTWRLGPRCGAVTRGQRSQHRRSTWHWEDVTASHAHLLGCATPRRRQLSRSRTDQCSGTQHWRDGKEHQDDRLVPKAVAGRPGTWWKGDETPAREDVAGAIPLCGRDFDDALVALRPLPLGASHVPLHSSLLCRRLQATGTRSRRLERRLQGEFRVAPPLRRQSSPTLSLPPLRSHVVRPVHVCRRRGPGAISNLGGHPVERRIHAHHPHACQRQVHARVLSGGRGVSRHPSQPQGSQVSGHDTFRRHGTGVLENEEGKEEGRLCSL
mmetsp:Transcript_29906/g.77449  ORF Transcript_29906/g.77449 Transcript_29906/m.77449 type:complete len:428 (-) Transcript_29906:828-2111(-)